MTILDNLFGDVSTTERAQKMELLKSMLDQSALEREARKAAGASWAPEAGWMYGSSPAATAIAQLTASADLQKAMSPDALASLQASLAQAQADLTKDISLTSPLSSGLVPYDLAPLAMVFRPPLTPLRNWIPRVAGTGSARKYKRITGFSNSGNSVANLDAAITDASTASFGSLTLLRGPKISYAADEKSINFKQFSLSDAITWSAEFAGLGFVDGRQLSQTVLLYASMLADERQLGFGRGTDSGFVGALSTPSTANVTITARNAAVGETGNTANIANVYITIAAENPFGESIRSSEINSTLLSAATGKVLDITMTGAFVAGATGFRVYVGAATGIANQFYVGRTGCWGGTSGLGTAAFTINFTGAGTGGIINAGTNASASETASSAAKYDGVFMTNLDPTQAGAIYSMGGKFSTSNPGIEVQRLLAALWTGNNITGMSGTQYQNGTLATPDVMWWNGLDLMQLSEAVKGGGSGNPAFFFNVPTSGGEGLTLGNQVTRIISEASTQPVTMQVHPMLPQGTAHALSSSLPTPDSQVPAPFQYMLPQDYLAINWPVVQFLYEASTYWNGALINYAPMFSGALVNILQG